MCRECCRSAPSRTLLLELTERERDSTAFPCFSVRGRGGCRPIGNHSAGDCACAAVMAACRRRCCHAERCALPSMPLRLLLLLTAAIAVAETATVGQQSRYRRQETDNLAPHLSLEQQLAPSASDRLRSPFAAPATGSTEQRTGGLSSGADTVDLWPSYGSPAGHLTGSAKRSRRQLVERCATKMNGIGYFTTPQYPQLVTDGGYTCFWQLSVVYAGQTVSLDLSDLQTSRGDGSAGGQPDDCGDSYVAVADLSGHIVRYCSPQPRPVLVGENVYVWASGHAHASFGLRASFQSTFSAPDWNPTPPECGGRLQAGDAFATPRYPGAYPTTQTCFWAAAAAAGRRLMLVFDSFDVGRDSTCESDYVTVWTSERGLMPRLCGNTIPVNISTGVYIFVFFSSDGADDGGATGFRARFVADGETSTYMTTEVATAKATTIGVGQPTVGGATTAQPRSSAEPQPATSALPASASGSASPAPPSSSRATEPTGGFSSSSSSSAYSEPSTTAAASTSSDAGFGNSTSPSSWGVTLPADGENNRTTSTTAVTQTTVFANVSAGGASNETPPPSASSSSYVSRMTTTTATLDRTSSTAGIGATPTSRRPASSSVAGTGSHSTTRSSQTLGDSAQTTTGPAAVQPDSELSSSSLSSSLPTTTPQPGSGSSTPLSDVPSLSTTPFPTVPATSELRNASIAQQPPRTVPPTPEASSASSGASTTPTTTTPRRRCKLRQKSPAAAASQSTEAPPR